MNLLVMERFLFLLLFSLLVFPVAAQNTLEPEPGEEQDTATTTIIDEKNGSSLTDTFPGGNRLLLVPYEPKLYMSDIDHWVAEETGLEPMQIKKRIRFGLDNELYAVLKKDHEVISFVRTNNPDQNRKLRNIYKSIGYKYQPVPLQDLPGAEEEDTSGVRGFFRKLSGQNKREEPKGSDDRRVMEEGQIKDRREEDQEKFMNARPVDPGLFRYLRKEYDARYILFINQLDIKLKARPGQPPQKKESYDRMIKVHYTLFDRQGEEIYGSAAMEHLPAEVNDLNGIIRDHFPPIARNIRANIPEPVSADSSRGSGPKKQKREEVYEDEDY